MACCPHLCPFSYRHTAITVLASIGYPGSYTKGVEMAFFEAQALGIRNVPRRYYSQRWQSSDHQGRALTVIDIWENLLPAFEKTKKELTAIKFEGAISLHSFPLAGQVKVF